MLRIKSTVHKQNEKYVALKSVSIDTKIRSFGADVNITQLFRNDENQPIEAVYYFPIEENAAIYSFTAIIDDRQIHAQLKEKIQAQQEYSQALAQGHGAYLMEQDEKSQDIFIINIGGLLPGKECRIEIKYVTELSLINGNQIRFVIPTTIAPRYNPSIGGISSPVNSTTKYVQSVPYKIDFRCQIDKMNERITGVSSTSHPINIQFNENLYEITLSQTNTCLDRDIILDIQLSMQTNTILAIEKNNEHHQLALMAAFTPNIEDCQKILQTNTTNNDVNNEFIFIVDCSGSMEDENKIDLARQAMMLFLKSLPVNCQFNIIRFGSNYQILFSNITDKYNEENAKQAEQLIINMSADLGGTELLKPFQWLQNNPPNINHSRQIFLLTDGEISNISQVMDLCRSMSTSSRIFSFGLGHSPSRALIKGLARSTNGRFVFIPPGTSVDIYVAEEFQRAFQPCLTNIKIKWNIPSLKSSKLQTVPMVVPPVYANDRLLFYALIDTDQFDHSTTIELWNDQETVRFGLAKIDHIPEILTDDNTNSQLITHLAAKALIQEIIHAKESVGGSQQVRFQQAKGDDNRKRLIDISLKYNILCPHTAFIGIEKRTDPSSKNTNSNMVLREIPIQISADDKSMNNSSSPPHFFNSLSKNRPPPPPLPPGMLTQSCQQYPFPQCALPPPPPPPPPMTIRTYDSGHSSQQHFQQQSHPLPPPPPPPSLPLRPVALPGMAMGTTHGYPKYKLSTRSNLATNNDQKRWPSNDQDIVRHLINLQKFDGLWNMNDDDIKNLCQKSLASFQSNLTNDSIILTTSIVIVILEMKFNSYQTLWSFVVNKGKKRLEELLGDQKKVEQIFNDIKNQL